MNKTLLLLLLILFNQIVKGQEKEILIIGTMHTVPKIVKKSYKPLLRKALSYKPGAIYVESPRPKDSISWEYLKDGWSDNYKRFYFLSDSLQKNFDFDQEKLDFLLSKDFRDLSGSELDLIIYSFGFLRDNANYDFYKYLKEFGADGSIKPSRHEDGDLTAKLALTLNIKKLHSMDDQQTNEEYHTAWQNCAKDGRTNGDNKINTKLNKQDYNKAIIPALFRRLGMHVNNRKSLGRLHQLASFTYVKNKTEGCALGEKYWNERNERMANNIGDQVMASSHKKNIVIVGAAHVLGLEKELKTNFSKLKIILIND